MQEDTVPTPDAPTSAVKEWLDGVKDIIVSDMTRAMADAEMLREYSDHSDGCDGNCTHPLVDAVHEAFIDHVDRMLNSLSILNMTVARESEKYITT